MEVSLYRQRYKPNHVKLLFAIITQSKKQGRGDFPSHLAHIIYWHDADNDKESLQR